MTCALPQTTGGKDEPNIAFMRKSQRTLQHGTQNIKTHNRTKQKTKMMCNTDPTKQLGLTQVILKGKLFLLLIRYTYSQSSPVKSLGDDRGKTRGRRDRMIVGFTTTCAISGYHD
jgi:hypothetical protein